MTTIDDIIDATVRRVRASGMLTDNVLMGTCSAVGTDGTITVTRPGPAATNGGAGTTQTYPKVRLIGTLNRPAVNDKVEICNTAGGWVCIGVLQTSNAPRIVARSAVTNTHPTNNVWVTSSYTFPEPFATTPLVVASLNIAVPGTELIYLSVSARSTTGFSVMSRRNTNTAALTFNYIASDLS